MAEERIRVLVAKDPCENCGLEPCARKCIFAQMYEKEPAIAKSEAIEKMAKALDEAYLNRNKDYIFHFGLLAEAALNALLEDK